jgi:hypothetical protein
MKSDTFIDIGHHQIFKHGECVGGDVFLSQKIMGYDRVVSVLSDGLGSGIKASVLATLTSTMATRFATNYRDIKSTAHLIMKTLPVCSERKISYSTFTIVDIDKQGHARVIEYGNPAALIVSGEGEIAIPNKKEEIQIDSPTDRTVHFSEYTVTHGGRIIFCSDGVTQSGMGSASTPLGWTEKALEAFVKKELCNEPCISARELAKRITGEAHRHDSGKAKDDITCGVIYLRKPRRTLLVSGPPIHAEQDTVLAERVSSFHGDTIVCGGTTANIIGRELRREISVNLKMIDPEVPPASRMAGVSIVTEGILTLCKVSELLEKGVHPDQYKKNAAGKVLELLLNSDHIYFLIGTKINEVHQDPNMPVEIEIRRNIIKKIKNELEEKHLKQVALEYI